MSDYTQNEINAVSTVPSVKNTHINHLEDVMFLDGTKGLQTTIYFIEQLYRSLCGKVNDVNITTKWDGSPAIVFGKNPDNGKQFVATKSAFNKEPKLMYNFDDIRRYYPVGELNKVFETFWTYVPVIDGVYQGDLMFLPSNLVYRKIQDKTYVIFTPNTITYAVPYDTNLAEIITRTKLGVVVHTKYIGDTFATLQPCYNFNIGELPVTPNTWVRDASYTLSRVLTDLEKDASHNHFYILHGLLKIVNPQVLNKFVTLKQLQDLTIHFINDMIRQNKSTSICAADWLKYVRDQLDAKIILAKKTATKIKLTKDKDELMVWIDDNFVQLMTIFQLHMQIVYLKNSFLRVLNKEEQPIKTFIGDKPTTPEGYVLSNKQNQVVKLVDRFEFSYHNFKRNDV